MWHEKLKKPNKLGISRDDPNYMKVWREKNRHKYNEYYIKRRANMTPEERKAMYDSRKEYRKEYREKNRGRLLEEQWKKKHGIIDLTYERYEQTLKEQDNKCAICEKTMNETNKAQADHDHKTGKFRAILCWRCNVDLGIFEKNFNAFKKYIDRFTKT